MLQPSTRQMTDGRTITLSLVHNAWYKAHSAYCELEVEEPVGITKLAGRTNSQSVEDTSVLYWSKVAPRATVADC